MRLLKSKEADKSKNGKLGQKKMSAIKLDPNPSLNSNLITIFFAFQELIKDMLVAEKLASSIMTDVQSVLREFRKEVMISSISHSRFGHYFCSNLYGHAPRGPKGVKKLDFFLQIKLLS